MELIKTRIQLINAAAGKLQIKATGQDLEPEYEEQIDEMVDPLFLQLSVDRICDVVNDQQIPSEWFDCLACLLANIAAPDFGKQFDPGAKALYEAFLKRLTASRYTREVAEAEYF